jgi:hypothetical protein
MRAHHAASTDTTIARTLISFIAIDPHPQTHIKARSVVAQYWSA